MDHARAVMIANGAGPIRAVWRHFHASGLAGRLGAFFGDCGDRMLASEFIADWKPRH